MKSIKIIYLLILVVLSTEIPDKDIKDDNPKPFVVPELKQWTGSTGEIQISDKTKIIIKENDLKMQKVAEQFQKDLLEMFKIKLEIAFSGVQGDFNFEIDKNETMGKEGYQMHIYQSVDIVAATHQGLFWATRTILQILEQSPNLSIPCGAIYDEPDYPLRGFMLDAGRKYIPLYYVKDIVKIMSYYKMNCLHIHLNDNGFRQYFENNWQKTYSAFRLECETFPKLTARDGHYSKKEFIEFQKEAENLYVEIIPEFDAPAHVLAFTHFKESIGSKDYGMDHLDLFNDETYDFLDKIYDEYLGGENPVFIGKRMHIGTDEYSNAKKEVVEKFRYFTDRYIKLVESYGKQACLWGSLTHAQGDTKVKANNVVMDCWYNGYADPQEMKKQGYKLISVPDGLVYIVPAAGYYYDYLNEQNLYDNWTPAHIGGVTFDEKDPAVLGGKFAIWNDHVGNGISIKDIHHRIFSAMQTMSVKMWTATAKTLDYATFNTKRKMLSEAPGVNQLGRITKDVEQKVVYEEAKIEPNKEYPHEEVGYSYTVTMDIEPKTEKFGTELFRSKHAVFYLSDPVNGMMSFSRDGYLFKYRYSLREGAKITLKLVGDNQRTSLYINDKLIDKFSIAKLYYDNGDTNMMFVKTLMFPLKTSGNFTSTITNLKVMNYCQE